MEGKKERAIVTGGAGFIGGHLVEFLLKNNFEVKVVDNMVNGQRENIERFKGNPNYHFHLKDISQDLEEELFSDADYVFHIAGLADIIPSIENPISYYNTNVTGTVNVLEAAKKSKNLKKFVYAASSSCYGIPDIFPTPETAEIRPEYPYALTKRLGEECVLHWNKAYHLPAVSLRLFNVYGPRARSNKTYGAVFKVFLTQKLNDAPLTIVGDGTQKRDFVFIDDVVRAIYYAAISDLSGECINIGKGQPRSINELASMISNKHVHIPKRPGEPDATWADINKAKKLLDWQPKTSLEEGVQIMLNDIEYWKDAPVWTPESIQKETKSWFDHLNH
ncbi:MAG: SDR family oxidoreductase [Candidatus Pacearchaeota archaeon]|nr:SDR family oxidoreductase [Candidatus Pacearchaeota archaeon]